MSTPPTLDDRLRVRDRQAGRCAMYQTWQRLLFLHWRFDPDVVQRSLPDGLTVDTFDGSAWVGIVPFFMKNIRPWWSPAVPGVSNFLELNLRTYVYDRSGTPGVWFYSLDANRRLAVRWARTLFNLPYFDSRMSAAIDADDGVDYSNHRRGSGAASRFQYRPSGAFRQAGPGSLEFFLVERYILFAQGRSGTLSSGQVYHPPYRIGDVSVPAWSDQVFADNGTGLPRPGRPFDHALYAPGVDVEVFPLRILNASLPR